MVDWSAVLLGFLTSILLGMIGGVTVPFTDLSFPLLSSATTGLIAGFVAGWISRGGLWVGVLHGVLATALGSFIIVILLSIAGILFTGIFGFSILLTGLIIIFATSIPGAVGGAIGGWLTG